MNKAIEQMREHALQAKLEGTLDWMRERADVMYDPKALDRKIREISQRDPGVGRR
jgi:hypothetical protein